MRSFRSWTRRMRRRRPRKRIDGDEEIVFRKENYAKESDSLHPGCTIASRNHRQLTRAIAKRQAQRQQGRRRTGAAHAAGSLEPSRARWFYGGVLEVRGSDFLFRGQTNQRLAGDAGSL